MLVFEKIIMLNDKLYRLSGLFTKRRDLKVLQGLALKKCKENTLDLSLLLFATMDIRNHMAKASRADDDFVKTFVKVSVRRMIWGTVICFAVMSTTFLLLFPSCSRYETVTDVRQTANKYYLAFKGETGLFGMWSEKPASVGDRICIRPTFAQ